MVGTHTLSVEGLTTGIDQIYVHVRDGASPLCAVHKPTATFKVRVFLSFPVSCARKMGARPERTKMRWQSITFSSSPLSEYERAVILRMSVSTIVRQG